MTRKYSQPTQRHSDARKANLLLLALCIVAIIALGFGSYVFLSQPSPSQSYEDTTSSNAQEELTEQTPSEQRASFLAVGDNLPEIQMSIYADACAGLSGDGSYDYSPIFAPLKPFVEKADLSYMNFEVHAGGNDIGPRGYPSFNTMDSMVDAVYGTGFDMIASATNHSYDWAQDALNHSISLWKQKDVLYTGTASSQEDADLIKTIERNGIVFSLLNYTYGVNGYEESEIPSYAINYMHADKIASDIARAREISDVVMVSMHWGTENQTTADDQQLYYAQLIANAGADVILGSHPHVIGPVTWIEGATGNKTLVAYSLGNFISNHEIPAPLNELGGMLQCDFVKTAEEVAIENLSWTPLINHSEENIFAVYALQDYTAELALRHRTLSQLENPLAWLKNTSIEIVGPEISVVPD